MVDKIPAQHAFIVWSSNDSGQVTKLLVTDFTDEPTRRRVNALDYDSSMGACTMEWMQPPSSPTDRVSWYYTPQGVFLWIVTLQGFASKDAKIAVLHEFNKIEGCVWAMRLLEELGVVFDED
jgi:hypothetical protein